MRNDYTIVIDVDPADTFGLDAKKVELDDEMTTGFVAFYKPNAPARRCMSSWTRWSSKPRG